MIGGSSYGGWVQWSSATPGQPPPDGHPPRRHGDEPPSRPRLPRRRPQPRRPADVGPPDERPGRTSTSTTSTGSEAFRMLPLSRRRRGDGPGHPALARLDRARGRGRAGGSRSTSIAAGHDVTTPALVMGGWYDLYSSRHVRLLAGLPDPRAAALRVTESDRGRALAARPERVDEHGRRRLRRRARCSISTALEERWFDRWLRDVPQRRRRRAAGQGLRDGREPVA